MTEQTKVLREAQNKVEVVGIVNENTLERKQFDDRVNGGKYWAISGVIGVKVEENENHNIRFFAKELRNDGKLSGKYTGLETVMNSISSVADLAENPDVVPTKVRVRGNLELNEYYGGDGLLRSNVQIQGGFVNRLEDNDPTEHKAVFDIEGVVQKLLPEFDREGEETGRKKLTLAVPSYRGVDPMEFTLEGEGVEYAEDNFTNGVSINIVGKVVNFRKETTKTTEMGFGSKEETKVEFNSERLVVSGGAYEEGVHDAKIFDTELIKKSLVQRNVKLEQKKNEGQQTPNQNKPQGFDGASTPKTESNAPKVDASMFF